MNASSRSSSKLHRQQEVNDQRLEAIAVEAQAVEANQAKLLEAYYADAIDRELFLPHQRRLNTEQANLVREKAKLESANIEIHQRVRDALDLLQDVHATSTSAPATVRKQLNQAIVSGIFLGPRTRSDPRRAQRALRHHHHPTPMRPRQPKSP